MKERQQRIYELVCQQGNATVEQLKQAVFASGATIRRDLEQMERQGLLLRVWGGAVAAGKADCDPPSFVRNTANMGAKKKIAQTACALLKNNVSVFLPSGTTVTQLAKLLGQFKNLTVITNCPEVMELWKHQPSVKMICLGGEVYEGYDLAGPMTVQNIGNYHADYLFFSCSGLTAEGFTSHDAQRLEIIQAMQRNSAKTVLLADTSKVGKSYLYKGFGFAEIDHVIMEQLPPDDALGKTLGDKLTVAF